MPRPRHLGALMLLLAAILGAALVAGCGEDEAEPSALMPGSARLVEDPFSGGYPAYHDESAGLRVILGTPDLGAGPSRIAFALFDEVGLIEFPGLLVRTYFYPEGPEAMRLGPLEQAVL
ncbi:MAG: hypothetical protein Q7K37_11205, partial [Dehalococcoidia bacterium]|nr:hypothetical protein [Dehalococcoidia bacterium]